MQTWHAPTRPAVISTPTNVEQLHLYDTARGTVVPIVPGDEETTRMYVCGITPYDATHLGHAFTYLTFDLVQRVWRDLGYAVRYVQNVTDVDDPLLERANDTNQDWRELAASQIQLFRDDMEALRVFPPDHWVAATDTIEMVTDMVSELAAAGKAYRLDGDYPDWYVENSAIDGFGSISHLDHDTQLAEFAAKGGDPERHGKRDPLDALVWRAERAGEPAWDSPLGRGRPGWHIECATIARRHLGFGFDLQGGGLDLAFPHHEMCASLAFGLGAPFANAYVHVGMVAMDGEKMSKSLGNLELVSRLRNQGVDPGVIRLAVINHHYRDDWEWFASQIGDAQRRIDAWRAAIHADAGVASAPVISAMRDALREDLDTPRAVAAVDEWSQATLAGGDDAAAPAQIGAAIDALLGIAL